MCILLTTTHSCRHKIRSAIPCGSKSLACDSTFEYTTKYYSCEDCQCNLALALEAKAGRIDSHRCPEETRGYHDDTTATLVSDSRADDFSTPFRLGSLSPFIGWGNLRRTRERREEAEVLERVDPNYLADRRASSSSLSSLGSTVSTPSAFADIVPQDRRESTSSISSLGSTVSTPSAFADPVPQNRRPIARKRPRAREPTPEEESSESDSDDDGPPPLTCPRHAGRSEGYGATKCKECERVRDGTAVLHPKPADIVEDWTRADIKAKPTWKGWVPVARVPAGEFQRLPKFDRRGVPVVDNTDAPVPRSRAAKRRKTTGGKRPRIG